MKPSDTFLTKKDSVNIFGIYLENTNKILHYALIALLPFGKIIIFKRGNSDVLQEMRKAAK